MTKRHWRVSGTSLIIALVGLLLGYSAFTGGTEKERSAEAASAVLASVPGLPAGRSPEIYQGSFLYRTAEDMLRADGVTWAPEDKIAAFPDPALGLGSTVQLYRATPVSVTDGTVTTSYRTWAATVGDLLAERDIQLGDSDIAVPPVSTLIRPDRDSLSITITRVSETKVEVSKVVAYAVQTVDDPTIDKGSQSVAQAGVNGTKVLTYLVHRENGVETSRSLVSQAVAKEPVPEIIHKGTKVVTYGTGGASWYQGVGSMTAAHRTLPLGTKVLVTNLANGKSVVVTIADRGPFVSGRIIDLSKDAFAAIGSLGSGVMNVRIDKTD